jgi:hypothetical protein
MKGLVAKYLIYIMFSIATGLFFALAWKIPVSLIGFKVGY